MQPVGVDLKLISVVERSKAAARTEHQRGERTQQVIPSFPLRRGCWGGGAKRMPRVTEAIENNRRS